jgi:large subunit ribosomal protein L29
MMKAKELSKIRELSPAELNKKLEDLKGELFLLRFQHATNQLDNALKLKDVKRDIARIKTILREKELRENA